MRIAVLCALLACSSKHHDNDAKPAPAPSPTPGPVSDGGTPDASRWPELEDYPVIAADRVIALPARPDVPRFDVGGPAVLGDIAVVSSSQSGFVAVDWRRGTVAWTKPADLRVAPPLAQGQTFVLVGDCTNPPQIPDREELVGCLRVVTASGTDRAYLAIHARRGTVAAFAAARGAQTTWSDGEHSVRWRRGDAALTIDLLTGVARPADPAPPPVVVQYRAQRWEIRHEDGRIVARTPGVKKPAWETQHRYTLMLGPVWLPQQSPMLRIANLGHFGRTPEVHLLDIDATGSLHGQVARPAPGIGILGHTTSTRGDAALAVRIDSSLSRDVVVGYAANATLVWAYPLPEVQRLDPVGLAIAPRSSSGAGAVLVFHDGDTVAVLPELSTAPTTPGEAGAASRFPTP